MRERGDKLRKKEQSKNFQKVFFYYYYYYFYLMIKHTNQELSQSRDNVNSSSLLYALRPILIIT